MLERLVEILKSDKNEFLVQFIRDKITYEDCSGKVLKTEKSETLKVLRNTKLNIK